MKKKISLLCSALFLSTLLSVGLISCSNDDKNKDPDTNQNEGDNQDNSNNNEGSGNKDEESNTITISEARKAIDDTKVKVKGTVVKLFKYEDNKDAGFLLADNSGSIIIEDKALASKVNEGNIISLEGTKNKSGYLTSTSLISNDNKVNEIDYSKATELDIIDCFNAENKDATLIGNLYKAQATIKSEYCPNTSDPSKSYTKYSLEDPSGEKYLQVYSRNSGKDFAWLDEYDGMTKTVYYFVINIKQDKFPRVIPVQVSEIGNQNIDDRYVPNYIMDHYIDNQFKYDYDMDPELELITKISVPEKGIGEVTITYTSSNEEIATISEVNGKTILNLISPTVSEEDTVSIFAKATYKETHTSKRTYSFRSSISTNVIKTNNIAEILEVPSFDDGGSSLVQFKGTIYASGDLNRKTFYVGDSTGVILVDATNKPEILPGLNIGDEVKIEGWKYNKTDKKTSYLCARIEPNILHVTKEVSTTSSEVILDKSSYVTDKDLAYLVSLSTDNSVDQTNKIYTVEAKVDKSNLVYTPTDGDPVILPIYNGKAETLLWAKTTEQVKMDVALVNLNDSSSYSAAILAIYKADGSVVRNLANLTEYRA